MKNAANFKEFGLFSAKSENKRAEKIGAGGDENLGIFLLWP